MKVKDLLLIFVSLTNICFIVNQPPQDITDKTQCITYNTLIYYNYTDIIQNYDGTKVFAENFCYHTLTYNITNSDFNNLLQLNLKAFKIFRSLLNYWYMYNNTAVTINMDDACLSYLRHASCLSTINACVYNSNGTLSTNGICQSFCSTYYIYCGSFSIPSLCQNNSTETYCAGVNSSIRFSFNLIWLIGILFILIL